jgi:hypothetical protein
MLTFLTHRSAFDVTECRKPVGLRIDGVSLAGWSGLRFNGL